MTFLPSHRLGWLPDGLGDHEAFGRLPDQSTRSRGWSYGNRRHGHPALVRLKHHLNKPPS